MSQYSSDGLRWAYDLLPSGALRSTVHGAQSTQALPAAASRHDPGRLTGGLPVETPIAGGSQPVSWPLARGGSMTSLWQAFWSDESGQGLVEYALIIALVAVGLIAILLVLRNSIGNVFNNAATQLNNAPTSPYP